MRGWERNIGSGAAEMGGRPPLSLWSSRQWCPAIPVSNLERVTRVGRGSHRPDCMAFAIHRKHLTPSLPPTYAHLAPHPSPPTSASCWGLLVSCVLSYEPDTTWPGSRRRRGRARLILYFYRAHPREGSRYPAYPLGYCASSRRRYGLGVLVTGASFKPKTPARRPAASSWSVRSWRWNRDS